jgi:para-nitrobenzyl esterase
MKAGFVTESALARTLLGTLAGQRTGSLSVFRGIRYAQAPTGARRFKAPVPVEPWEGTKPAVDYGPVPHQLPIAAGLLIPESASELNADEGEDCLSLNVVTPGTEGRRPVLVYIHGGNFVEGAGSQQWSEPSALAERGDVVAVTVNYRLGALGWLYLDELGGDAIGADNNLGLRDQIAALEWVRDNIAAFGGDPDNVTLYGYSAGAWSISALMAAGCAPRLFGKAIVMSGGVRCHTRAEATALTRKILDDIGVVDGQLERLREIPPSRFTEALAAVWDSEGHPFPPIRPVADGELVPLDPQAAIAGGTAAGMKAIVGSTLDEFKLVATMDLEAQELDDRSLLARFEDLGVETAQAVIDAYRTARAARGDSTSPTDLYWALDSDRMFSVPGLRVAEAHSAIEPDTWMYQVRWKAGDPRLGACHSVDLALMFGGLDLPGMEVLSGTSPEAHALSEQLMDAWATFARTGDPNHDGMPEWPRYDVRRRATMILDAPCSVVDAPLAEERKAWEGVL